MATAGALALVLAACGSDGDDPDEVVGEDPADSDTDNGVEAADGDVVITYLNSSAGQEQALIELNERYMEEHPGVIIELTTVAQDYPQDLLARAQSDAMPDLYYPGQTGLMDEHARYVEEGWPLDLTGEMEAGWSDSFRPELLDYVTYEDGNPYGVDPGIYSIPFDGNNWQILYNPELWEEAGLDPTNPPADFDGLLDALTQLKEVTNQPFAMNLGQPYGTTAFVMTYGSNAMPMEDMIATLQGEASWDTDEWREVLGLYERLRDADVLAPGSVIWEMPDLEQAFFSQQRLASYFGFAISVPVGDRLDPDFMGYGAFMPPPMNAGEEIWLAGGMGKSVAVNGRSENADAALDYLRWFMEPEQQAEYAELLPTIPAHPEVAADEDSLDPRVVPFNEGMPHILPPEAAMSTDTQEVLNRGVQEIFNRDSTIDEVIEALDASQSGS